MNIDKFKSDHVAIMTSVSELRRLVHAGVAANADAISKAIISMSSTIKLHLASEDQMLYPKLIGSTDRKAADLAKRFKTEMGAIATVYVDFSRKWNLASMVEADPEGFRTEAGNIFKALHERIQRENQELYPAAEGV